MSSTVFYAPGDEESFFRWLHSIEGYVTCKGRGTILYVTFSLAGTTKSTLREIAALLRRYDIRDMKQLRTLAGSRHKKWFSDPKWHWHQAVFGEV